MGDHAKLSPSAAHRWLVCPASVREAANTVSSDTDASKKGTATHEAMKLLLDGADVPAVASNGVTIDAAMLAMAQDAVVWVRKYLHGKRAHTLMAEEKVEIGPFFGLEQGVFYGTADVLALADNELLVFDLKTGYVSVQAEENPQLLAYAVGASEEMGWLFDTVRMVIFQPAEGGAKEWVLSKADLVARAEALKPKVALALTDDAPYHPTEEGCRYCPAAGVCKALQAQSLALAQREFTDVDTFVNHLTPEELSAILSKADLIETAVKAAREHALKLIQTGQPVPGWKMVEGRRNRVWKEGSEGFVVSTLEVLGYEPDNYAPRKLLSPAQVEKLLKNKDVVAGFIEKPAGSPVLAPESDKRPALAGQVFDAIPDTGNLLS
jgi:hypothetical protein